jgi:hypothetical protein
MDWRLTDHDRVALDLMQEEQCTLVLLVTVTNFLLYIKVITLK